MEKYIIVIKQEYVRDVQILNAYREITDEDYETLCFEDSIEEDDKIMKWQDSIDDVIFVGMIEAESEEEAIKKAATKTGFNEVILTAFDINCNFEFLELC